MQRLNELTELEADLRSAALVLARLATNDARRTDLDEAITAFGFDRADLEAELDADLAADRPVHSAGMTKADVEAMAPEVAMQTWEAFITRPDE